MRIRHHSNIPPAPPPSPANSERLPRIPRIPFTDSADLFEIQNTPESIDPKGISKSFDIEGAKILCDNDAYRTDMQEIAQHNSRRILDGSLVYVFDRTPITYSLNQAFQALELCGIVSAKVAQANVTEDECTFSLIPDREKRLTSLDDLSEWWSREKLLRLS